MWRGGRLERYRRGVGDRRGCGDGGNFWEGGWKREIAHSKAEKTGQSPGTLPTAKRGILRQTGKKRKKFKVHTDEGERSGGEEDEEKSGKREVTRDQGERREEVYLVQLDFHTFGSIFF